MPDDSFENECDRLSNAVDNVQFERIRWARHEAPMLASLVELVRHVIQDRPDFELADEGSKGALRRFVLKVHGFRIIAVNVALEVPKVVVWGEPIERSKYRIVDGQRRSADFPDVDEAWMKAALSGIFGEIQSAE
jgi:hypothetical protein